MPIDGMTFAQWSTSLTRRLANSTGVRRRRSCGRQQAVPADVDDAGNGLVDRGSIRQFGESRLLGGCDVANTDSLRLRQWLGQRSETHPDVADEPIHTRQ